MTLPFTVHSIKKCSCHPRLLLLITSTILREWLSGTEGNRWLKWILIPTSYNPRLLFWLAKPADRIISLPSTLFLNQLNRWHFRNVTSNPIMLFILIKLCIRAWPSLYPWPVDEPLSGVSGFRLHRPSPRKFSKSIFTSYQSHLGTEKNTMRVCLGKM